MLQLLASVFIDAIDASPLDEIFVVGIPAVAIAEGLIIYWTTKSKTLALMGMAESVVPVVDIVPFATISWIIKHGKLIGILFLALLVAVMYLLEWITHNAKSVMRQSVCAKHLSGNRTYRGIIHF